MVDSDLLSFLWLFCHEEEYANSPSCHVLWADGKLVRLCKDGRVLEEVLPSATWTVTGLPLIAVANGESKTERHGIIVDPGIAEQLRSFTTSFLGESRNGNDYVNSPTI